MFKKGGAKENENTQKRNQKRQPREKRFGARGHLVQKFVLCIFVGGNGHVSVFH